MITNLFRIFIWDFFWWVPKGDLLKTSGNSAPLLKQSMLVLFPADIHQPVGLSPCSFACEVCADCQWNHWGLRPAWIYANRVENLDHEIQYNFCAVKQVGLKHISFRHKACGKMSITEKNKPLVKKLDLKCIQTWEHYLEP